MGYGDSEKFGASNMGYDPWKSTATAPTVTEKDKKKKKKVVDSSSDDDDVGESDDEDAWDDSDEEDKKKKAKKASKKSAEAKKKGLEKAPKADRKLEQPAAQVKAPEPVKAAPVAPV